MAFENCKLEDEEQREYIIPYTNEKVEFGGGTIVRKIIFDCTCIQMDELIKAPLCIAMKDKSNVFVEL